MKPLITAIEETALFSAGNTRVIDVRLAGYVTQIDVDITLNVTPATSVTPFGDDEPLRIIKALKFTASNSKDFISFRDGREAWWMSYIKSQGQATTAALPAAGAGATDVVVQFSIHPGGIFGAGVKDVTRVIPLRNLSNVEMQITWGTNADLGTGFTTNADDTEMAITIHRMVLQKGESEADAFAPSNFLMVPRYQPVEYVMDAIMASYGFSQNILTGSYMRDVLLMVLSTADLRSNADVTQFNVSDNLGNTPQKWTSWARWLRVVRQKMYLPAALTGVGMLFFSDITNEDYGLDMVGANLGDWMLNFTTATATGTIHAVYEGADMVSIDPTEVGR